MLERGDISGPEDIVAGRFNADQVNRLSGVAVPGIFPREWSSSLEWEGLRVRAEVSCEWVGKQL